MPSVLGSLAVLLCVSQVLAQDVIKCGKDDFVSSAKYLVVTNAWNGTTGTQCLSIAPDASAFNSTWEYPVDRTQTHAYPHVKFQSKALPIALSNLTSLDIKSTWDYIVPTDANLFCNVALDMFADVDAAKAQNETLATYELMVWWGLYGAPVPEPLGFKVGAQATKTLNGIDFSLYTGTNSRGTTVLTWIAGSTVKNVDLDVYPLIQILTTGSFINQTNVLLGLVQMGSEAFGATQNVTFQLSDYSMTIQPNATSPYSPSGTATSSTPKKGDAESLIPQLSVVLFSLLAGFAVIF